MKTIDVFGIGNPLIDLLANVDDSFLEAHGLQKDRMYLLGTEQQLSLVGGLTSQNIAMNSAAGGSCANSMIGINQLGGKASFTGKIGNDEHGKSYDQKLKDAGVVSLVVPEEGLTGASLILIAEDSSRVMNTYLGMCQELGPNDIREEQIVGAKYLYFTGYLWDTEKQKNAVKKALQVAKDYEIPIAMSLSDPFCVHRHTADFLQILEQYVDVVFCNQEEAFALYGTTVTQHAIHALAKLVDTIALTMGSKGALISHQGHVEYIDPYPVDAKDTTGAGDAFAAGVLFGMTNDYSLLNSGRIGSKFASLVVEQIGPRLESLPEDFFQLVGEYQ